MQNKIRQLLLQHGISLCAPIALCDCRITRSYLLERAKIKDGTAFLFAVPYYTTECDDPARNISAYAVSRDYHGFMTSLFDEVLPLLQQEYPSCRFTGFADHSPIAEVEAAARAGLGVIGQNGLFLTKEYSSYVFLGEIVTDAVLPITAGEIKECIGCGECRKACPVSLDPAACLSALTQKKGELTKEEQDKLLCHGLAWGCDRCQEVCPYTKAAKARGSIYTTIPYFKKEAIPHLTECHVLEMTDDIFAARAYSWRGRSTIARNLKILEKGESE